MTVPFALSVHAFINKVGADAGFASIIGLALLILLYFAQMRETSTLRRALDEASARVAQLEARLAQLARAQVAAASKPAVAPRPAVPLKPMGSALASLGISNPAAIAGRPVPILPGAPAGVGAPALASATKLIPTPIVVPAAPPAAIPKPTPVAAAPAGAVPAAATAAASAATPGGPLPPPPPLPGSTALEDTVLVPPPGFTSPSNGNAAGPPPPSAGEPPPDLSWAREESLPPRAQIVDEPAPPRHSLTPGGRRTEPGRSRAARVVLPLVGLAVVAVAVILLINATGGGSATHATNSSPTTGTGALPSPTGGGGHHHHPSATAFNPASVTVTVLNGTPITGLATDVLNVLANGGYKSGVAANAAVQTQTASVVGYLPGNQVAADNVAKALGLRPSAVQPASQAAVVACAQGTSTTTSTASTTCPANVVVTVGSDLQHDASNT